MTKEQKALEELRDMYQTAYNIANWERCEAIETAIEALEMRAEEEPTNIQKNLGMYFGLCPDCRCNVSSADSYCSVCGQALRWKK